MAADLKKAFEALPHVNTVWVTQDDNFHLHPHNGGKEISRGEVIKEVKPKPVDEKPAEQK